MGRLLVIVVLGLTVASGPNRDTDSTIRSAKIAFEKADLPSANRLLEQAFHTTDDPGLVAFNRAILLAANGDFRAAELDFIRCLDDEWCPRVRKSKALFNRGVCLLKHGSTATQFRVAIESFQSVLRDSTLDAAFESDLRHNVELAKLLWAQARTKEAKPPTPNDVPADEPRRDPPMSRPPEPNEREANPTGTATEPKNQNGFAKSNGQAQPTDQTSPGSGTLTPLPDQDHVEKRSPEDTKIHLLKAATRLEAERRSNAELLAGPERKGVRDW